ncbi:MAG TPA: DUF1638 domain-containing protein [Spirochaetota bacterium]|nr:DUF1638 domain-containing protein [Spirochaetota bacterium]
MIDLYDNNTCWRRNIKFKIISCNVMNRELRYCASRSLHRTDIEFLPAGLHERPEKLNMFLKEAIQKTDAEEYDGILLNYGLCGNGTLGVSHPEIPIVVHNCHDCIPILMGNKKQHEEWVAEKPGTFFYSCGWIDEMLVPGCPDYDEKYLELYGRTIDSRQRDTVERILIANYTHLMYIYWKEMGLLLQEKGRSYTKECLFSLNERFGLDLAYREARGSSALVQSIVDGEWDEERVVIVEPGQELGFDAPSGTLFAG